MEIHEAGSDGRCSSIIAVEDSANAAGYKAYVYNVTVHNQNPEKTDFQMLFNGNTGTCVTSAYFEIILEKL